MKTDVQWMVQISGASGSEICAVVRAIQADALRHAAELCLEQYEDPAWHLFYRTAAKICSERLQSEARRLEAKP